MKMQSQNKSQGILSLKEIIMRLPRLNLIVQRNLRLRSRHSLSLYGLNPLLLLRHLPRLNHQAAVAEQRLHRAVAAVRAGISRKEEFVGQYF